MFSIPIYSNNMVQHEEDQPQWVTTCHSPQREGKGKKRCNNTIIIIMKHIQYSDK